jgi:hypothetical protein
VPSGRTLIFAGFRSRWMIPCSWATSSASAICLAMASASSSGIRPCAMRSASVGPRPAPSRSHGRRSILPGHRSARVGMVQRGQRCSLPAQTVRRAPSRLAKRSGRTLIATLRSSFRSRALVHLSHPTRADERDDVVGAKARTGGKDPSVADETVLIVAGGSLAAKAKDGPLELVIQVRLPLCPWCRLC